MSEVIATTMFDYGEEQVCPQTQTAKSECGSRIDPSGSATSNLFVSSYIILSRKMMPQP